MASLYGLASLGETRRWIHRSRTAAKSQVQPSGPIGKSVRFQAIRIWAASSEIRTQSWHDQSATPTQPCGVIRPTVQRRVGARAS